MNHVYKPSGKISLLFFPVFVINIFIIAVCAFICIFCIHFSPYSLFDAIIFIFATIVTARYSALCCVKTGKVRNPFFSAISGIILGLSYWYFIVIFYLPVKSMFIMQSFYLLNEPPSGILKIFNFKELTNAISMLKNNGAAITGKKGGVYFTMPGNICIIILIISCITSIIFFASEFYKNSRNPFCETSGKWMKKFIFTSNVPEDDELFISRLLLGDCTMLSYLEPLHEVNIDHFKISLYTSSFNDKFYVSLSYMENSGKLDKKTGKIKFNENEIIEYLEIDNDTGRSLLTRSQYNPEDASVIVVTDESKRKAYRWIIFNWIIGILAISLCVLAIFKLEDNLQEFLFKGGFFYIALIFFANAIRFIRTMQKEMVITSTEDKYEYEGTKKSLSKETEAPVILKLFYLFMMASAVGLFVLCIMKM
ncbi:MAG: hypothetical protein HFH68_16965 [Lachnospiraceae bacterium]|nr:hypothetical protein [Lachnospiraceae bacterium]